MVQTEYEANLHLTDSGSTFLPLFGFASIFFFLRFIPESTAGIILDFRLIICIILCQKAQSDFINVVQSRSLPSF